MNTYFKSFPLSLISENKILIIIFIQPLICSCRRPLTPGNSLQAEGYLLPGRRAHQRDTGLGASDAHGLQPNESQTGKEGASARRVRVRIRVSMHDAAQRGAPGGLAQVGSSP